MNGTKAMMNAEGWTMKRRNFCFPRYLFPFITHRSSFIAII